MPHLQQLYAELKEKGLEIVAVNSGDSQDTVARYFRNSGFTFPPALGTPSDAVFKQYAVDSFPANYLLDAEGRIVWRAVGYGPGTLDQLRKALERLDVR